MITGIGTPSNHNRSPRPIVFSSKCNRGVNARCRGRFLCGKEAGAKERFTIPEWRLRVGRHSLSRVPVRNGAFAHITSR
jgi:hypothetical protein